MKHHKFFFYDKESWKNIYKNYEAKVELNHFFSEVETRIPVQICTLEEGNVVPLIRGRRENYQFYEKMNIAERSKLLDFGIIEKLL